MVMLLAFTGWALLGGAAKFAVVLVHIALMISGSMMSSPVKTKLPLSRESHEQRSFTVYG